MAHFHSNKIVALLWLPKKDLLKRGQVLFKLGYYELAFECYKLASDQGNAMAQLQLGNMFYFGKGKKKNNNTASIWYKMAAINGNANAQYMLGCMFSENEITGGSCKEIFDWFKLAAEQGHVTAQAELGQIYYFGQFLQKKDIDEAIKWLSLAANQGNGFAQNLMGKIYHEGSGIERDYKKAYICYELAEQQGIDSNLIED